MPSIHGPMLLAGNGFKFQESCTINWRLQSWQSLLENAFHFILPLYVMALLFPFILVCACPSCVRRQARPLISCTCFVNICNLL